MQCWDSSSRGEFTPGSSGNRGVGPSWEQAFSGRIPCIMSQPGTWSLAEPWIRVEAPVHSSVQEPGLVHWVNVAWSWWCAEG